MKVPEENLGKYICNVELVKTIQQKEGAREKK